MKDVGILNYKVGEIYKIAYKPKLSKATKKIIKENVFPSMENEYTSQYLLESIFELRQKIDIIKDDLELLEYMYKEKNIECIEINNKVKRISFVKFEMSE